jgi:hypothetical protein
MLHKRGVVLVGLALVSACSLLFDPSAESASDGLADGGEGGGSLEGGALEDGPPGEAGDPVHCGPTARDCLGGACIADRCQPVVLAEGEVTPLELYLDGDMIYWVNGGHSDAGAGFADSALRRIRKDGSGRQTVWSDPAYRKFTDVAVDSENAYVTAQNTGTVVRVPKNGGGAFVVSSTEKGPVHVTVDRDAGKLYWFNAGSGDVIREQSLGIGATPRTVATDTQAFYGGSFALTPSTIYWSNSSTFAIHQVARNCPDASGCPKVLVADGGNGLGPLAIDNDVVFWGSGNAGELWRAAIDGGQRRRLVAATVGIRGMAIDAEYVYFTVQEFLSPRGSVMRIRKDGSTGPEILSSNEVWPSAIAVDDVAIYWLSLGTMTGFGLFEQGDGKLSKMAK